jgi:lipoate-protein ligase A
MEYNFWRLIINAPAQGAWNMAVDEAILEATASASQPTTLRLYAWNPYCLSLGQSQSISDIDEQRLRAAGWELVRRPTGGKAILHADELTYCICASKDDPHVAGSVLDSYRHLSLGLLAALQNLGLSVNAEPQKAASERDTTNPICFEVPSDYEIKLNNKKIIGSAQARKANGVLQHGAIPLYGDISRITQVLAFKNDEKRDQAANQLHIRATNIAAASKDKVTWKQAAQALICGFGNALNVEIRIGRLSDLERGRAKQLVEEKYACDTWTRRL